MAEFSKRKHGSEEQALGPGCRRYCRRRPVAHAARVSCSTWRGRSRGRRQLRDSQGGGHRLGRSRRAVAGDDHHRGARAAPRCSPGAPRTPSALSRAPAALGHLARHDARGEEEEDRSRRVRTGGRRVRIERERERALGRERATGRERRATGRDEIFPDGLRRRSWSWSIYLIEWIWMGSRSR